MKTVAIYSYAKDLQKKKIGEVRLVDGELYWDLPPNWVKQIAKGAMLGDEFVTPAEPDKYLDALVVDLSGSMIRAELIEES